MPSGPQTVTSHFLKKCNKREPEFFFFRNKLELIFVYVTANLFYRPNFLHEKKTCSRILIYYVKVENVNTSMPQQTCAKTRAILQKLLLPLL